jgi:hypothetical protein
MARIILAGYMFRYPLGGMLSNTLQYLVGLNKLGHDVFFVEKSVYEDTCFNPDLKIMTNKCSYGIKHVSALLSRFNMNNKWCFCDYKGNHYGLSKKNVEELFKSVDLFIDYGAHGTWNKEAGKINLKVLIDGEPGTTQMKMLLKEKKGEKLPEYDHYYTVGQNIGEKNCTVPEAGRDWRKIFHPVDTEQFTNVPTICNGVFTTVMNWQSRENLEFEGVIYGHKDMEFEKFLTLPNKTNDIFDIAVAGPRIPNDKLKENHWNIINAHQVTLTYDYFIDFVVNSKGEFSVCKNIFVVTNSGWFSDRSAVYLACGKPVIMQETGFSKHLPCGIGLFAVRDVDEALSAIDKINTDYEYHSRMAREIAREYLDTTKVMNNFLVEIF